MLKRLLLAALCLLLLSSTALGHDHLNPFANEWLKTLSNQQGLACCAGDDATHIATWDVVNNHFRVFLDNIWITVPDDAVVKQNNHDGIARVWTQYLDGFPQIRCFLPGSMG